MNTINNIIPFPRVEAGNNPLPRNTLKKIFNIHLNISLENAVFLEASHSNRLLKTAIDLHRQINNVGFLQMTQANQKIFNSIDKIIELDSMSLFFPEISSIDMDLQESLLCFIKNKPQNNLFFIFGSSIPFTELEKKQLIATEFNSLEKKIIRINSSLIEILNQSFVCS